MPSGQVTDPTDNTATVTGIIIAIVVILIIIIIIMILIKRRLIDISGTLSLACVIFVFLVSVPFCQPLHLQYMLHSHTVIGTGGFMETGG